MARSVRRVCRFGEQETATDPPLSGWPVPRKHCTLGLSCPGKVEPVPHTDNALCMPEHVDQADCDRRCGLPSDRDDSGDCHMGGGRVMGEAGR